MEREEQSELCFPQAANISCRKPSAGWSQGVSGSLLLYLTCALTVLLNLLVITSISHFRQLRSPTNLLLLSLAVSDLLVGLLVWPGEIHLNAACWTHGDIACSLYNLVSFTVTSASVGNMVLLSADRYAAVCRPLRYKVNVTVKRIRLCVCCCWLCSLLLSSVLMKDDLAHPGKHASCYGECGIRIEYAAAVLDLLVTFILPLGVIAALYGRVFAAAASQARAMRSRVTGGERQRSLPMRAKKSELKAARTLGILVLVFLMCFCPYYCVTLAADGSPGASVVLNVYYLNSCVNPLIYAWFYPWFRRAVKHIVTLRVLRPGSRRADLL
ncbi:trace amine-associated receptor 13c-like [Hippocampus comes]|uniref:trace amine-associated receptor 13c-like n=1 Tax=Hippocampus comes TaxID=109280 RepID=UPI00094EB2AE|nr:PREDICTED: trace amine-associated receptor 13c-like [Hippocampus comes]